MPEVVPFRLTQNMVHAMGPMGTEGLFRQACEVTLRLMRDQREPLMRYTHIHTFVLLNKIELFYHKQNVCLFLILILKVC